MAKRENEEEDGTRGKEGRNLLGKPKFKRMENGRFRCVETRHEVPADGRDSYAQTKHCRLGLIDSALATNKPPLDMFEQDPTSLSKLVCKLTGVTINKTEEHIWKHINGKRFLIELEKKEAEKLTPSEKVEEQSEQTEQKTSNPKEEGLKTKKDKKKQEENSGELISGAEKNKYSDKEFGLWMPSKRERRDFDNDRWDSGSESGLETEDIEGGDAAAPEEDKNAAGKLSKRKKRKLVETGHSNFASTKTKKKKKKKQKKTKSA